MLGIVFIIEALWGRDVYDDVVYLSGGKVNQIFLVLVEIRIWKRRRKAKKPIVLSLVVYLDHFGTCQRAAKNAQNKITKIHRIGRTMVVVVIQILALMEVQRNQLPEVH
jgi:hypothetical protein